MRSRISAWLTWLTWLTCACATLTACSHGGTSRESPSTPATTFGSGISDGPAAHRPSSIAGATTSRVPSSATLGTPTLGTLTTGGSAAAHHAPQVLPPAGTNPSGVICDYVSRTDVAPVLPGTPAGQEIDLESTAVSYCDFGSASLGTVNVGVKNMGTRDGAETAVRNPYNRMSQEPDQSTHTFTVGGQFAFQNATATPLTTGGTLYAVNAQGSRGTWYVTIQYYAHRSCSSTAMQRLLEAVLAKVPA